MPTKKTAKKTAGTKKLKTVEEVIDKQTPGVPDSASGLYDLPQTSKSKTKYIIIGVLIIVAILIYFFKGLIVAATVNGEPVYRLSVISELEKQAGKQALGSMVTKTLILQEARRKQVVVSNNEVDVEVKKINDSLAKQGQNLDQVLLMQGVSKQDFVEQVRLQKLAEKLVSSEVKVTDKEVNDYIQQNKETLPQNLNLDDLKKQVTETIKQQKMSTKLQELIQNLQKNAKINYFVNY